MFHYLLPLFTLDVPPAQTLNHPRISRAARYRPIGRNTAGKSNHPDLDPPTTSITPGNCNHPSSIAIVAVAIRPFAVLLTMPHLSRQQKIMHYLIFFGSSIELSSANDEKKGVDRKRRSFPISAVRHVHHEGRRAGELWCLQPAPPIPS
ncbi:hypothetical protein K432DRAFT_62560 [Lepidopterella palustris CBS 459.81]|uniref:Uncharacterized protein n=1 Tax=Lepidopterella palustris CBS 459.81 TaxID=1314670 RepID=A0A8E2E911_9PEZI|nr:hypothetical protein K432DRAFT_62560 [Lepidopterella palustris CBS 459.81]